jgi:hypothetical protein
MISNRQDRCRNANSGRSAGYIFENNSVCSDQGMVPNLHTTEYLGASADIDMSAQNWRTSRRAAGADCHLLEYRAIGSYD